MISPMFGRTKRAGAGTRTPIPLNVPVLGQSLKAYELGEGAPIIFLHSGLGGAEVWLRVLPMVSDLGRCSAVDPIGFGESTRPHLTRPGEFDFRTQQAYFDSFMESEFPNERVTFVLSGLSSILGFNWAQRHEQQVRAICHMESIIRPMMWPDLSREVRETLKLARGDDGELLVLYSDDYFDRIMAEQLAERPSSEARSQMLRLLGVAPHLRLTLFASLLDLPINGQPAASHMMIQRYADWLKESEMPKLLILGEPGYLIRGRMRASALKLKNQTVVAVHGKHVLPIDAPSGVGRLLSAWLRTQV